MTITTMRSNIESIDDSTPIQDRIRLFLNQYGSRDVSLTVDQLADKLGLSYPQTYQGLKRLENLGEIEFEKETSPYRDKLDRITGIKLIRLEPSSRTYRRAADRAKKLTVLGGSPQAFPKGEADPTFPRIMEYLNKKLAIEELRARAISSGLDESVIQFETNDLAEEAIALLKIVSDLKSEVANLSDQKRLTEFDLEAERRNSATYKNKLRDETQEDLRNYNVQ